MAGIASSAQAKRLIKNLPALEEKNGLVTSVYVTGNQWDAPFGWAPLQFFAVKGLARYGDCIDAKRIAAKFNHTINHNFTVYHVIFEKYNMRIPVESLKPDIQFGYVSNETGFGWTNAVYLLFDDLLKNKGTNCFTSLS